MELLTSINFIGLTILFYQLKCERRKVRILSAFVAGAIEALGTSISALENLGKCIDGKNEVHEYKASYKYVLEFVHHNLNKDFWSEPWGKSYEKWLKKDRNLFYERSLANGGFNEMYQDLHDEACKEWNTEKALRKERN